jgi:hypothetical protein
VDRSDAVTWVQNNGFTPLLDLIGRTTNDDGSGVGPALDRAFSLYGTTTVTAVDEYEFTRLVSATIYDLAVPTVCLYVDGQVDAPLTKVSGSQLCRQIKALRDEAYIQAGSLGVTTEYAGGYVANLDFLEPDETNEGT